jgi:hypothetical protein
MRMFKRNPSRVGGCGQSLTITITALIKTQITIAICM